MELRRTRGFAPEELVTFNNVPVPAIGQTNFLTITNRVGGVEISLTEFARKPDITGGSWSSSDASWIRVEYAKIAEGKSFDFVEIVGNDGIPLEVLSRSWSGSYYEVFVKSIPVGTKTVDITNALQTTRNVEFMVKPETVRPEKMSFEH